MFDLDGTLVDSRRDLAESANAVLAECGCPPLAEDAIGRMVGDGAATLVARAFAASGCSQPAGALDRFLAIYNGRLLRCTRAYAGVAETLAALQARVALAVLTNKPYRPAMTILEGLDLARYFAPGFVIGGDGPFARKPDPGGLLRLIAQAGETPQHAMLVGDSVIDWRAARAAGTAICLARYGFGYEGFPVAELSGRDRVVDRPEELLSLLS